MSRRISFHLVLMSAFFIGNLLVGAQALAAIQSVEFYRSVGVQTGGNAEFIPGKNTVVRAVLSSAVNIDQNRTSVTVTPSNGGTVFAISPEPYAAATGTVDFFCSDLPAGTYRFVVKVNDETMTREGVAFEESAAPANTYAGRAITSSSTVGGASAGVQKASKIQSVEINQSIGVQKNGAANFVAGKTTVVRALLTAALTVDPDRTSVTVTPHNGGAVFTLSPGPYSAATSTVDFACSNLPACGNWAAGLYTFRVKVNDEIMTRSNVEFKERRKLRILAVPMNVYRSGYGQTIPFYSPDSTNEENKAKEKKLKELWKFAVKTYPVPNQIDWKVGKVLDVTDTKYDVDSDDGISAIWDILAELNPKSCKQSRMGKDCYDQIIGYAPTSVLGSYGLSQGGSVVSLVDFRSDADSTLAHEMAHALGQVGDTYAGGHFRCDLNPAPASFTGKDWDTDSPTVCTNGGAAYDDAARIPLEAHPYDTMESTAAFSTAKADFMGTEHRVSEEWITPDVYARLFATLTPRSSTAAAGKSVRDSITQERFIGFSGHISTTGVVELEPWSSFMSTASVEPDPTMEVLNPNFTLQALDAQNTVLASRGFAVRFSLLTDPPRDVDSAPFDGAMQFPNATTTFRIVRNSDNMVLKTIQVNAVAPTVSGVTPASSTTLEGLQIIQWSATSASPLYSTVEYNPDITDPASPWETLVANIGETQTEVDFDDLPGGLHAQIRVTVTDGVIASSAVSAEFAVPVKSPEVYIDDAPTYCQLGKEIVLEVEGYDLQDGVLPDDHISWQSNISGLIGQGSVQRVSNLPLGQHIITVTVTNSAGLSSSETLSLTVGTSPYIPPGITGSNGGKGMAGPLVFTGVAWLLYKNRKRKK